MGERGNSVLFTKKRLFTRLITVKNPDDLAKIQFLTKNTDIIFTHEICGLAQNYSMSALGRKQTLKTGERRTTPLIPLRSMKAGAAYNGIYKNLYPEA
jgi:hypothetical protein